MDCSHPDTGSTTSSDSQNPHLVLRTTQNRPLQIGTNNLKNHGVPTIHVVQPENSTANTRARATAEENGPYRLYMVNKLAVSIRNTRSSRGRGVFAIYDFPEGQRIIFEGPVFSCAAPVENNAAIWRTVLAERWCSIPDMHQLYCKYKFVNLKEMPMGAQHLSPHQSRRFFSFIKEYAFCNPPKSLLHVYPLAGHINHACSRCANAEVWIDSGPPHRITVRLVKRVRRGEEIFINYNRPAGNPFSCAVCRDRQGIKSHLKASWHSMGQWLSKVSSPRHQDVQGEAAPEPSQAIGADATAGPTEAEASQDVKAAAATAPADVVTRSSQPHIEVRTIPRDAGVTPYSDTPRDDESSEISIPFRYRFMARLRLYCARIR
ncbi:hypothetical protein TrVFT333_005322 [Trichoderma virens FT-333]|nr:hypothetical protein TrVFT333_005322 [Trichoderma virens FT-333]